jgi:hypothetical protein
VPIPSGVASVAVTRRRMKEMAQCPSEPSRGPPMLATAGRRDMSWKDAGDGRHASCPATGTWSAPGSSSLRLSKRMNELSWARMSAVLGFQSSSLAEPPLPRHWTLVVYGRGAIRENSRTRAPSIPLSGTARPWTAPREATGASPGAGSLLEGSCLALEPRPLRKFAGPARAG